MCIWNKILVGLISVASIVFFYMAARALQTETYWSGTAQKFERRIKQVNKESQELAEGAQEQPGIRQIRMDLHKLLLDRRRMWSKCDPKVKLSADGATAEVTVAVDQTIGRGEKVQSVPHGIVKGLVVYAFEKADIQDKGQYIGEFTVSNTGEKQVTLVPTSKLSPHALDKLKKTNNRPWVLYEILPRDNHEIFASLTDAEKKALLPTLPPESLQEYLKDGKPAEKNDPADRVVNGKFVRPVIDYGVVFTSERDQRILLVDSIEAVAKDMQLVQAALVEARAQEEACKRNIDSTEEELKKMTQERDVVGTLHQKLEKSLDAVQKYITRLTETNQAMAGQIAKFQLEAARRIDERTRTMAQSGAGRL